MKHRIKFDHLAAFFYDLFFLRKYPFLFNLIKIFCLPFWLFFRIIDNPERNFFHLRTEIFGEQLAQFQALNQYVMDSKKSVYFNFHPVVKGNFVIEEQLKQLSILHNVSRCTHSWVILRLFCDSLDKSISKRLGIRRKYIISSLRDLGYGSTHLNFSRFEIFPRFSEVELSAQRKYLQSKFENIRDDSLIIALNSRTGNFQKYRKFPKENMEFRNTDFSELAESIKNFQSPKIQYLRIGHFEEESDCESNMWIDSRRKIEEDDRLQLSSFNSCNAYFGSSNGPISYFVAQRKPCLVVSVYPIEYEYPLQAHSMVLIPKIIWKRNEGKYMDLEEQFSLNLLKIQNLYNDKLLIDKGFYPTSMPSAITTEVYINWVRSILLNITGSEWLEKSIRATSEFRIKTNLPNLPVIPYQFFERAKSYNCY